MTKFTIRAINGTDQEWLPTFVAKHWGSLMQVVRGEPFYPHDLDGFAAIEKDEVVGLITYRFLEGQDETCEISTLNSVHSGLGIGSALVEAVVHVAQKANCHKLIVVTTNDNLKALRFYQKRGFVLSQLRPNALVASRQLKPEIPLKGCDDIPLRDEIELEMKL